MNKEVQDKMVSSENVKMNERRWLSERTTAERENRGGRRERRPSSRYKTRRDSPTKVQNFLARACRSNAGASGEKESVILHSLGGRMGIAGATTSSAGPRLMLCVFIY